jgi:hypothetical protein
MGLKAQSHAFNATGVSPSILLAGKYNVSIRGAFSGTISIQRSFDDGVSWGIVDSYTAETEQVGEEPEGALYRFYCSAYTSGNPICRFGL